MRNYLTIWAKLLLFCSKFAKMISQQNYGPLVKWSRRHPLTVESGVRFSYGLPSNLKIAFFVGKFMFFSYYVSPIGKIKILSDGAAIKEMYFDETSCESVTCPIIDKTKEWLNDYFACNATNTLIKINTLDI